MAPVVQALAAARISSQVCVTGQHRTMLDQVLTHFGLTADYDLNLMQANQTPSAVAARTMEAIEPVLSQARPDWVLVQGDTTTAMAAGIAVFYRKIKLAHIEAGLRTNHKHSPFPEEINRRLLAVVADMHFAPTEKARTALLAEGHAASSIVITGNTGIDALEWTRHALAGGQSVPQADITEYAGEHSLVLATLHRRESFDGGIKRICLAIRNIAEQLPAIRIVLPVHPNPQVRPVVQAALAGLPNVWLTEPLDYATLVWLQDRASLIITDSGGIQEEATFLGRPMLIVRETTERPEAVANGNAELVGTERDRISARAMAILTNCDLRTRMSKPSTIFGDGTAAGKIVAALQKMH